MHDTTCCFTGHRPQKLQKSEEEVVAALKQAVDAAVSDGYTTFISGMAQGVDIWAAECVLRRKQTGVPLRLLCAVPYEGFAAHWSRKWRARYAAVLAGADTVQTLSPSYYRGCYQKRNEWMVCRSSRLIAVYNGTPGGTHNTILAAQELGIQIVCTFAEGTSASYNERQERRREQS